jgi:hypothetical protein
MLVQPRGCYFAHGSEVGFVVVSPEVPGRDLNPAPEPQIGDTYVPRLAPEPIICALVRAAPVPRLISAPVRHWERLATPAHAPQQVREVDQVLGNQVDHLALALHPAAAGQQAG